MHHGSKHDRNALHQRNLAGMSKEDLDRKRLAAYRGHAEFAARLDTQMSEKMKRRLADLEKRFGA